MRLIYSLILIGLLRSNLVFADLRVSEISVHCEDTFSCSEVTSRLNILKRKFADWDEFYKLIKLISLDEGFQYFDMKFQVLDDNEADLTKIKADFYLKQRHLVKEINYNIQSSIPVEMPEIISLEENSYFAQDKLDNSILHIKQHLIDAGFPKPLVVANVRTVRKMDIVDFTIYPNQPMMVSDFEIESKNYFLVKFLSDSIREFWDKPLNELDLKNNLNVAQENLFKHGYFNILLDYKIIAINDHEIKINILTKNNTQFIYSFSGQKSFNDQILNKSLVDLHRLFKRELSDEDIISQIQEIYQTKAFYNIEAKVVRTEFLSFKGESVKKINIKINENQKYLLGDVKFVGNYSENDKILKNEFNRFWKNAGNKKYFNQETISSFNLYLQEFYIEKGYASFLIKKPNVYIDHDKKVIHVDFNFQEGKICRVELNKIDGLTKSDFKNIKRFISFKNGNKFNPKLFEEDLTKIEDYFLNAGYYFFRFESKDPEVILNFSDDLTKVAIKLKAIKGNQLYVNQVLVIGNKYTKSDVLDRKIVLDENQLLTPDFISSTQKNFSSTGLFRLVQVFPIAANRKDDEKYFNDIVVSVKERDFGQIDIAPGFRTDIGLKLSGSIKYINLFGENKSGLLTGQVNQRLDFNTFDDRRREEAKSMLEYKVDFNYQQSEVFQYPIKYNFDISSRRRRFYSFDADILILGNNFYKDINPHLTTYIGHEFQESAQFDATHVADKGKFQIGALIPGVTLDYRDNPTNPLRGAWFDLSVERANPTFLSQSYDDLTIDYYKIFSRNRFYLPIHNGVFASSFTFGTQENLRKDYLRNERGEIEYSDETGKALTEGYIPSIKVFRLAGMDIVRGYEEREINRLPSKENIGDVTVDSKANLVNIKLEPRYFINDFMMMGVFYDAGRVTLNHYEFDKLKSSVGLTFKLLTPVGSLDFDYGIKLLRERDLDGRLESPGRLHVSIGFF